MKPHEEEWTVVGCGNPAHGPSMTCWKVKNAHGQVMLRGVDKATAERYAALPAMARALLAVLNAANSRSVYSMLPDEINMAEAALREAGVLE